MKNLNLQDDIVLCKKEIETALSNGLPKSAIYKAIMERYGINYNTARKRVGRVINALSTSQAPSTDVTAPEIGKIQPIQQTYDGVAGSTTFIGNISLKPGQNIGPDDVMVQYGLDPSLWKVQGYTINEWNGMQGVQKGNALAILKQFKLTVTPKKPEEITAEDIIEAINKSNVKHVVLPKFKKRNNGYVVEIAIPDVHIGLLSWRHETGEDYDLAIAQQQYMNAIHEIYEKLLLFKIPIKKILIVTMGDFIHIDNDSGETTKGTRQDIDGRSPKISQISLQLMIDTINLFAKLQAPIEYIYIRGNHDKVLGHFLALALREIYRNAKDIEVDCTPNPHKYRKIGKVALGWTHGNMSKKNIDGLMNQMVRDQTDVEYKCLHVGHYHSSASHTTTDGGCYVEFLDSVCPPSSWEHEQGFGVTPERSITTFLWDGRPTPPDRIIGRVKKN